MASKGSLRKSLRVCWTKEKKREGNDGRNRGVEKIFANARDDPSGAGEREKEKESSGQRKHAH